MPTEQQIALIRAAQDGNAESANELFNAIYNDVYYFARKTVQDETLACDITQEALIDIFNHLGDLKDPAAFPAWSRQITYHQCTRYFRKNKEIAVGEDEEGASLFDTIAEENAEFIPAEALDQQDFRHTIMRFIDTLPEEQRAAVMMYYFDELSVSDIAAIQGVSAGTVKSRLNYARKAIKAQVEAYEDKNGIKLHAIPFIPFIQWLFAPDKAALTMPIAAAEATAAAVGVSAGTVAAGAAASAAVPVTFAAKLAALPIVTKIIAAGAAAVLLAGSVAGGIALMGEDEKERSPEQYDDYCLETVVIVTTRSTAENDYTTATTDYAEPTGRPETTTLTRHETTTVPRPETTTKTPLRPTKDYTTTTKKYTEEAVD